MSDEKIKSEPFELDLLELSLIRISVIEEM